ncbi:YihY/virulence factor BrkB family protein [Cellulomonas wangsupingiae]|uniref:YihY/virulence factor BrkB family protein n=1 Tax=Cellulomonas wangsupingiae TaxID=2968085 RepID=UPI001D0E49D9|nr:YihY/virulence factor BrkB family protein [Cellulomonas wangsupingiae]MCM0641275.1 YihY/virulence factor BrkB family protein [Cellulomonas wangsupingiae]
MDDTRTTAAGDGTAPVGPGGGDEAGAAARKADAPAPDDPRKPDSPAQLRKPSWGYVLRTTVREFMDDQCTDLAAALTYYAVLALAPALLAVVSLLGLVSDPDEAVTRITDVARDAGAGSAVETLEPILQNLADAPSAGLALVVGLVVALWSASGYVTAFGRGMNRIYEVDEGRPIWKLRPVLFVLTTVLVLIAVLVVAFLALSGPVAESVGSAVGLSDTVVSVWQVAKWPLVLVLVVTAVALLYHGTPNVRQPRFRWVSVGALIAIVVWLLASAGLGLYVSQFADYGATYGSLAGVIVLLLWLWVSNLALLFGAELDAELERGRELQAGMAAERTLQLPPRDTRASDKRRARLEKDVERGRELRERAAARGE